MVEAFFEFYKFKGKNIKSCLYLTPDVMQRVQFGKNNRIDLGKREFKELITSNKKRNVKT